MGAPRETQDACLLQLKEVALFDHYTSAAIAPRNMENDA
jgi:hypothetical protein